MKLYLAIFSTVAATASATCNDNLEQQCEEYGGQCSQAALNFFNNEGSAKSTSRLLRYGRFCGASNKCPKNVIDIDICTDDKIDEACKEHDSCLDLLVNSGTGPIPVPERCPCDLAVMAGWAAVALGIPGFPAPATDLCDQDFYKAGVTAYGFGGATLDEVFSLGGQFNAVAIGLMAGFCSLFLDEGDCFNADPDVVYKGYTPVLGTLHLDLVTVNDLCTGIDNFL